MRRGLLSRLPSSALATESSYCGVPANNEMHLTRSALALAAAALAGDLGVLRTVEVPMSGERLT